MHKLMRFYNNLFRFDYRMCTENKYIFASSATWKGVRGNTHRILKINICCLSICAVKYSVR